MAAKTYETKFIIGAKFIGKPAFSQLDRAVARSVKGVAGAMKNFGSMFASFTASIGLATAAYVGFRKVFDLGAASYEAASEVKKAYDIVRQANALLAKEGRLAAENVEKQTQETLAYAEALSKSGIDAETLAAGLAGLSRSFSSEEIKQAGKGWMDWMVKVHKGIPTMEQAAASSEKLADFVISGKVRSLEGLEISKEQREELTKLDTIEERRLGTLAMIAKQTGMLAEFLKTDLGVAYTKQQAAEANLEKIGKPLVEGMREYNLAMTDLYKALEPVSDLIAGELKIGMQDLSKWISENKESIVAWAKWGVEFAAARIKELITSLQDCYKQAKWIWEHLVISFNDTKRQWLAIVDWLDAHIIKPTYWLFYWLWEKVDWLWQKIVPQLEAAAPAVSAVGQGGVWQHRIPQASDFRGAGGGGGGGGGTTEAGGGGLGSIEPNAAIAAERAAVMAELNDPEVRKLVAATIAQEMGSTETRADVLESLVNRAVVKKKSLRQLIEEGGRKSSFYGPYREGRVQAALARGMSPEAMEEFDRIAESVKQGRNRIKGRVDQGQTKEVAAPGRIHVGNEAYGFWNPATETNTAAYREANKLSEGPTRAKAAAGEDTIPLERGAKYYPYEREQKGASLRKNLRGIDMKGRMGGASPTNIAMSPTINVNGVAPGSENLIAAKVDRVLRSNSRENLAQLRRDRNYDLRTGYV